LQGSEERRDETQQSLAGKRWTGKRKNERLNDNKSLGGKRRKKRSTRSRGRSSKPDWKGNRKVDSQKN